MTDNPKTAPHVATPKNTDSPDKNYETAVQELEQILTQLESNQLPLEDAIAQFENGVELLKHCQSILDTTEQKIQGLLSQPTHVAQ